MVKDNDVVVTGLGVISSLGLNAAEFWEGLCAGRSGASPITHFNTDGHRSRIAAQIVGFDPVGRVGKKRSRRMARFSQLASCSALEAVENAGLDLEKENPARVGCSWGTAAGDYDNMEAQHSIIVEKGPGKGDPMAVPKIIPNMSSANISIDLGIHGPNLGTVTACSSSSHAIGTAAMMIKAGLADVMITGGSESAMTPMVVNSYACMGVLTERNDDPAGASRPFDRDRDGFLIGEAGAALVLESAAHARDRGAEILAVLSGFGMTSDGYSVAIPEPDGKWAGEAILSALAQAGLNREDLGYINAHGTSTKANDLTETRAIKYALGDLAYKIPVSSNKSMVGHNLGASGAVEAAATVLTVKNAILPPTINYENPDPECDLDYVPNEAREVPGLKAAASNSFGFGGQNGVLLFSKA